MAVARYLASLKCLGVATVLIFGGVFSSTHTQSTGPQRPVVVSAAVPLYPRMALLAHFQGTVRIRVTTAGKKVSSLDAESGAPMLVHAAADNLRTWRFGEHKPVTFLVTFQYGIEEPLQCEIGNATVVLHLPTVVGVDARGVHTCDSTSTTPNKKRQ